MHPGAAAYAALRWLDTHAGAVQAILAFVLTAITARYAWLTKKLLNQAESSTRAAERSAAASENTIAFMKQRIEEQRRLGPQIVAEAIGVTKALIHSWKHEASGLMPDPDAWTGISPVVLFAHLRK